jgi:acyl-coenzyme A thioesterase PaaI-like protein
MISGLDLVNAIREERSTPPSGITTLGLDRTHKWLERVEPGHVVMSWLVDDAYLNLEGSVICSWIIALADQALFFAGNTVCQEGEGTRMVELNASMISNISSGTVRIDARIDRRVENRMFGICTFTVDGALAARITATQYVTGA